MKTKVNFINVYALYRQGNSRFEVPQLQEILSILYLILSTADGNNSVIGACHGLVNLNLGIGLLTNLLNSVASLTNYSSSKLQHLFTNNFCLLELIKITYSYRYKIHET